MCRHTSPDLVGRPCRKTCLGHALIFKRWCCQSTLSRCTQGWPERGAAGTKQSERVYAKRKEEDDDFDDEGRQVMWSAGKRWITEGGGGGEEKERSAHFHCYLDKCCQAPAPLAETKWLAGIWCNLHLSAKSWILFLWSRCWRAWQKAQLTGPHSWERCLWPTYRGSSRQLRATTLIENGDMMWSLSLCCFQPGEFNGGRKYCELLSGYRTSASIVIILIKWKELKLNLPHEVTLHAS